MKYSDEQITFYLVVYRDFYRAHWCLRNVRHHFPAVRIVVDVDGDDDPAWRTLTDDFQAEVYYGERLFARERGAEIVKRAFAHHVNDPQQRRWFFRIDTDTEIRRRFNRLPSWDYFGTFIKWRNFIQGGCIGLTRRVCVEAFERQLFDMVELYNPLTWQGGTPEIAGERLNTYGLVSFDWIVNWAMTMLNVTARNFSEIRSTWKDPIPYSVDCAIAHPCKDIPVDRPI